MRNRPHFSGGGHLDGYSRDDGVSAIPEDEKRIKKVDIKEIPKEKNLVKNTYPDSVFLTEDVTYELDVYKSDGEYKGDYSYYFSYIDTNFSNYSDKVYLRIHLDGLNHYIFSGFPFKQNGKIVRYEFSSEDYKLLKTHPIKLIQVRDYLNNYQRTFYSKQYRKDPQHWFIPLASGIDEHYNVL